MWIANCIIDKQVTCNYSSTWTNIRYVDLPTYQCAAITFKADEVCHWGRYDSQGPR